MKPVHAVSVLIVSFNTRDLTLECLRSLERASHCDGYDLELIVVDNASSDGSADAVAEHFPGVRLVRSSVNLGFAAAVNLAADASTGDRLLLFNPDAALAPDCIDELLKASEADPGAGLFGGRIERRDGSVDATTARRLPSLGHLVASTFGIAALLRRIGVDIERAPGTAAATRPVPVGMLSGVLLMVDRPVWDRLGGFNPRFFMYGEDVDLSKRALAAGFRPTLVPTAKAIHDAGASSTSTRRAVLRLAGRATYIDEHWNPPVRRLGALVLQLGVLTRRAARRGGVDWAKVWADRSLWVEGYRRDPSARVGQLTAMGIEGAGPVAGSD